MAARPDDEVAGDPEQEAALPAAVGPAVAEGLVPPAEEWEHAWLPTWLSGSEADGVAGAGELPDPRVPPAGGADPSAGVPDGAPDDDGPDRAASEVAAVAEGGASDGPDAVGAQPPLVAVGTLRPRVVVAPRVRPRRRAGTAVALTLLIAGGIAGAVLLSGHSSDPVPTADRQPSPGAVAPPTRATPTTLPSAIADAVSAVPATTVPVPTNPVQAVSTATATAPMPAPVRARVAVPPAASPASVPAADAGPSVVVPPTPSESPVVVPTDGLTGPTAPTGPDVDPVVPTDEPVTTPPSPPVEDSGEDPVDDPEPTAPPIPTPTDVLPPDPADVLPPDPADVLPPDPADGGGTGTPVPGTPESTAPAPEGQLP
jgi:hypothetical protein